MNRFLSIISAYTSHQRKHRFTLIELLIVIAIIAILAGMLLRSAMMAHRFRPITGEWWHFVLDNEPYPETCFDYPVN